MKRSVAEHSEVSFIFLIRMQVWRKRTEKVLLVVKVSEERGQWRWQPGRGGVCEPCL